MTYFIQTGTETTQLTGSPTLTSLDGKERANFESILLTEREADFGVYNVDTSPPDGKQWVGGIDGTVTPPVAVFDDIPPIEVRRLTANISRAEFCEALAVYSVLSDVDAVKAAVGAWPEPMDSFLTYLTPEQARLAQIEWASCSTIDRTHTFVLSLASWLGMTDAEVDALFGL